MTTTYDQSMFLSHIHFNTNRHQQRRHLLTDKRRQTGFTDIAKTIRIYAHIGHELL